MDLPGRTAANFRFGREVLVSPQKMKALKWRDEARKNPVKDNEDVQCGESKNVFGRMSTFHMLSRWMDFV